MSYNGSGTFQINTTGQPVVAGTVISSTAFNALTADLATGLSTAITKDGQTATTARIPFAAGISSTLVTDSTSTSTGSIITAGGVGVAKALYVGTTANIAGVLSTTSPNITTSITTPSTSFDLINATATTLNLGGAATAVNVGAATGTMTVANTTLAAKAITASTTLGVTGTTTLTGVATLTANPVLSAGTANGVTYLNGSKSLTSGSAITFDGTNFATTGTATAAKLIPTGTSVTGNGLYLPAANALGLSTNGTNAVYIDASQNVGIGGASSFDISPAGTGQYPQLATWTTSSLIQSAFGYYGGAVAAGPTIAFIKSRSSTIGTNTAVVSGDLTGAIVFRGADGTNYKNVASMGSAVDGTVSAGIVPGRLTFSTTDTGGTLSERMRIDSNGLIGVKGAASTSWSSTYQVIQYNAGPALWSANNTNINLSSNIYNDGTNRYITSAGAGYVNAGTGGITLNSLQSGTAGNAVTVGAIFNVNTTDCVMTTANGGLGYGTGSGGTVTQGTSRTTAVTINKPTGAITMFTAAGSLTWSQFTVNNSLVAATDTIIVNQKAGAANFYVYQILAITAGSFNIGFASVSGVSSDGPVLNFAIIKGVTA